MIKHLTKISGVAAFAVVASTVSAEVKINENLSLDGFATAAAVVTEPSDGKDKVLFDSGRPYDSAKIAVNGKYDAFTAKVSLLTTPLDANDDKNGFGTADDNAGLQDAYVTYSANGFSVTGGKFLSWLGYEAFDTVGNAFISFGQSSYYGNYGTGGKVEYAGQGFSTGVSVRDSIDGAGSFLEGDGEFSDDLGYEAYFLYTGIDKLTVFLGAGYDENDGGDQLETYNAWVSYALTDKLTVAAEYANTDAVNYSWLALTSYQVNEKLSVAARLTGKETSTTETLGYGVASTYYLTGNFGLKAEVTKLDSDNGDDTFSYALQGIFKF